MITRSNKAIRILLAPSGFKEGLGVAEVIDCMARGIHAALPQAEILSAPMVDGGEGFTETLVALTRGHLHKVTVTGPVGRPVEAQFGFLGGRGRIAVLEMASAAGLRLVPAGARDPLRTTSRGVGELIRAALDAGAQRILVGCGDSGINDGGAGMAQALGIRLLDQDGAEIGPGGGALAGLRRIDLGGRDPRLDRVRIDVALNWHNQLLGPRGVSRVFGPQKGATPAAVAALEQALETYAAVVRRDLGIELRDMPGSGASGGLGAGLHALLGAKLHPRYDIVMRYIDIDALLRRADLVLTAEGSLDGQTPFGKVPSEIARRAKRYGLPVIALAGTVGPGAHLNLATGIDAYFSILTRPCSLAEALAEAPRLVADAAEQALRMVLAMSGTMAGTGASRRGRYGAAHGAVQAHHRV